VQAVAFGVVRNAKEQLDGSAGGDLTGTVLAGRYCIAQVISSGANTVLMDAIDERTEGQVTLKVVRSEHAQGEEFRRKFERLAEISHALTHPNIASVLDWGDVEIAGETTVFWVVDALGGGSLRDLLDRGRLLEPGQALVVGLEACRALDAAHQKGLFHTELTPSKMVFGADRRLRVVDFGMARLLAEPAWADAARVPAHVARYASPEQALGLPIDSKTDVYALALVLLEAVTGSVPFDADSTVATLAGRVDKLLSVSADLGPLASVLERAGRPESADRFTAAEFGRALVQVAPKLAKPEPIPILATGLFDTTAMRRPTDPTGGVERPSPAPSLSQVDEDGLAPVGISAEAVGIATVGVVGFAAGGFVNPPPVGAIDLTSGAAPNATPGAPGTAEDAVDGSTEGVEPSEGRTAPESSGVSDDLRIIDDTQASAEVDTPVDNVGVAQSELGVSVPLLPDLPTNTEAMPATVAAASAAVAGHATEAIPTISTPPLGVADAAVAGELFDDEARGKRGRGPVVLLLLLLVAGLGALGYAGSLLVQAKSFEVPALAGVSEDEAMNQIVGNAWLVTTSGERSDTFPEFDTVIRTDPGPGVELEEGQSFRLVLSEGPEFRILPEIASLPFDAAFGQLAGLGLSGLEAPEREFSETVAVGSIVVWKVQGDVEGDMRAGGNILPGETIVMTLSMGPAPRTVPDLTGQTIDAALSTAAQVQLVVVEGDTVFSEEIDIGVIVAQSPQEGSGLDRDGTITVQASKGIDRIEFPALESLSFSEAQTLLLEQGFTIGNLLGSTDGVFVEATVGGVEVVSGNMLRRGRAIDLIFL
jgi:beta-lactam-binding protein with PASTA domain